MAVTVKNIIPRRFAQTANTVEYTAPAKATIDKFTATNVTAAPVTISVFLTASGDAGVASNKVLDAKALAAHECYTCPEVVGQALEIGGTIVVIASAVSAVVLSAAGREIT